mmetsp:Transcript_61882/g.111285  ORF Transcript_61882/g.111285 Transcript_61882/m.111285 type:complete len:212 (+) Transcript_61882:160-795(+)
MVVLPAAQNAILAPSDIEAVDDLTIASWSCPLHGYRGFLHLNAVNNADVIWETRRSPHDQGLARPLGLTCLTEGLHTSMVVAPRDHSTKEGDIVNVLRHSAPISNLFEAGLLIFLLPIVWIWVSALNLNAVMKHHVGLRVHVIDEAKFLVKFLRTQPTDLQLEQPPLFGWHDFKAWWLWGPRKNGLRRWHGFCLGLRRLPCEGTSTNGVDW